MLIYTRSFCLLLFSVVIASCSTNQTKKLLNTIDTRIEKDYQIKNGYLIAAYDLAKLNNDNKGVYAKNFVKIINECDSNNQFLSRLKAKLKNIKIIESESLKKIYKIKALITKLNTKYKFLSKAQLAKFSDIEKTNSMMELSRIDQTISKIPMLAPEYQPIITSYYGIRKHPFLRKEKMHFGIDLFSCKSHCMVYSAANGKVEKAGKNKNGYGNVIEISHGIFRTRYAHLNRIFVKEGDIILRGQKIALQGCTGRAKKEHLHFEVLLNGKHINPLDFIYIW